MSRSLALEPERAESRALEVAVLLALTVVTSALLAPERGPWWDDALHFAVMHRAVMPAGVLTPIASPTRHLVGLPYALALATPWPDLILQAIYVAAVAGTALLARSVTLRLFPRQRLQAFLAGALTVTSTGDLLTNSTMGLHYVVTMLCYLGALELALAALFSERWLVPLLASVVVLQVALWDADVATPVIGLTPLLFAAAAGKGWRRVVAVTATWGGACLPFAWAFGRTLGDPAGYVASHLPVIGPLTRIGLAARLFAWDFTPWRWVFSRPSFYTLPPAVPPSHMAAVALLAAALGGTAALRFLPSARAATGAGRRDLLFGATFLLLGGASALVLAGIPYSSVYMRTQLVSRVWASLLLALLTAKLVRRARPAQLALVVPALFIFFGTWSGLQRQVYLVQAWQATREELLSIVDAAPRLAPGATMLLVHPATAHLLATEADYLAASWFDLLYDRRDSDHALFTWAEARHTGCLATTDGLRCWREGETPCTTAAPCTAPTLPYGRLVVLTFDATSGRYRLLERLPPSLLAGRSDLGRSYDPHRWIIPGRPTSLARKLLVNHRCLSRWLWSFGSRAPRPQRSRASQPPGSDQTRIQ